MQNVRKRKEMDDDLANGDKNATAGEAKRARKRKEPKEFDFNQHPKRKIALQFLYFGWNYDGLVQQEVTEQTVERYLESALVRTRLIPSMTECDFSRCGRTDKGVSAFKQVAACIVRSNDKAGAGVFWPKSTPSEVQEAYPQKEEHNYVQVLNRTLPRDIRVIAWAPVPLDFSARHSCTRRTYKYSFPRSEPRMDVEAMRAACRLLVGTHDFRNFAQIDLDPVHLEKSYVRDLYEARIDVIPERHSRERKGKDSEGTTIKKMENDGSEEVPLTSTSICDPEAQSQIPKLEFENSNTSPNPYDLIQLTVAASGFHYHQIRFIVWLLYQIGLGNERPEIITKLLDISAMPARPQYKMAVDTPLCLYETSYETSNLEWHYDDKMTKNTIEMLQKTWADYMTKAHLLRSMIIDLEGGTETEKVATGNGFYEFIMSQNCPKHYVPVEKLAKCYTIEQRRELLQKKLARKSENSSQAGDPEHLKENEKMDE